MRSNRARLPLLLPLIALVGLLSACDVKLTGTQQWEYLILTPGTIYTAPPDSDSTAEADRAKYLEAFPNGHDGYRGLPANIGRFTPQLDALGAQGWELVSIVGQIGSDQQYVFKRPKR